MTRALMKTQQQMVDQALHVQRHMTGEMMRQVTNAQRQVVSGWSEFYRAAPVLAACCGVPYHFWSQAVVPWGQASEQGAVGVPPIIPAVSLSYRELFTLWESTTRLTMGMVAQRATSPVATPFLQVYEDPFVLWDRAVRQAMAGEAEKTYHVQAQEDRWVVCEQGAADAVSIHDSQEEAVEGARTLARDRRPVRLVIHRADGAVQSQQTL